MPPQSDPRKSRAPCTRLRRALLSWFDVHRRDLPWRRSRDPYAIWISEVMLQQTTVATAVPYWQRFLARFPDVSSLAAASIEEVLTEWSGLGYYGRARNLHQAAAELVARHGGRLPGAASELERLPGVGAYTAAAVASIAFGEPVAAVDGNVVRVLSRVASIGGNPARLPARREIRDLAGALLDRRRPGDFNEALMELGAVVCTPRAPSCRSCPWSGACLAFAGGHPERFPQTPPPRATIEVLRAAGLVRDERGLVLLHRIDGRVANSGLWEFPTVTLHSGAGREDDAASPAPRAVSRAFEAQLGLAVRLSSPLGSIRHAITHHRIRVFLFAAKTVGALPEGDGWRLVREEEFGDQPLTSAARKLSRWLPWTAARQRPVSGNRGPVNAASARGRGRRPSRTS